MPTPRQYATNADRQAAYRARLAAPSPLGSPPCAAPGARRWRTLIGQARALLETVAGEMTHHEAARSEAWHDSERGERFAERQETLEEALALLSDLAEASRYASALRARGRNARAGTPEP